MSQRPLVQRFTTGIQQRAQQSRSGKPRGCRHRRQPGWAAAAFERQQEGFTLIVEVLSRHQGFSRLQRHPESLVASLPCVRLHAQAIIREGNALDHQRNLPVLANLLAVRNPAIGIRAQAMVNMDGPQLQRRVPFTPADQLM